MSQVFAVWTLFENAPQWWLQRGLPPTINDSRPWVRATQISLLLIGLGCLSTLVATTANAAYRALNPNFAYQPSILSVLPLAVIVLLPLSRCGGRSWTTSLLGVVALCTFHYWRIQSVHYAIGIDSFTVAALALWMAPWRTDRLSDVVVRTLSILILCQTVWGLNSLVSTTLGTPAWTARLPNPWRIVILYGFIFHGIALSHITIAVALGMRLWWHSPAAPFAGITQWWLIPACPPTLTDHNRWVRLTHLCVLAGALGTAAGLVIESVLFWMLYSPGPLTDRHILVGLLFGSMVLAPISHWLGRARWYMLLSLPIAAATFAIPTTFEIVPIRSQPGWIPGFEFMLPENTFVIGAFVLLWMYPDVWQFRRNAWAILVAFALAGLATCSPRLGASFWGFAGWGAFMATLAGLPLVRREPQREIETDGKPAIAAVDSVSSTNWN